jgi:translocation and assembly module TamA
VFSEAAASVGIGVRYYPGFGPVRLDIATPLDRRDGDSPVQVYISIGQAF